jgi:hypothetical protein
MTQDRPLSWGEIYERLARRPDRPDARAWAVLGERVRALTRDASLADETCAEVWRTFNVARGGASFEGFVQGRLVTVARRINPAPNPDLSHSERRSLDPHPALTTLPWGPFIPTALAGGDVGPAGRDYRAAHDIEADSRAAQRQGGGLVACLEELRARNPNHHRVLALLYEDQATIEQAADRLRIDPWTARSLTARARMALAQCLGRAARQRDARADGDTERPPQKKDRRAGRSGVRSGRQPQGRPRRGGRPR